MEIIDKKKFTKAVLDQDIEAFVMYKTYFSLNLMLIYPAQEVLIALPIVRKVQILTKYFNFWDVFLEKKTLILLKKIELKQYVIKLQKN